MNIEELTKTFSVPGIRFEEGNNGLTKVSVRNGQSIGELYLHGAHVTQFQPSGARQVLWMSDESMFADDKPIRGGVPICFPWFGPLASDPTAPGHGFARLQNWEVASATPTTSGGTEIELRTKIQNYDLSYCVTFGKSLQLLLTVQLSKDAGEPAKFEQALHTYFSISDIRKVSIEGLEQVKYIDKVDGASLKPASGDAIRFTGECDRVYLHTTDTCRLNDPGMKRTIVVAKAGSRTSVVWNPWIAKSAKMADFGDHEWPGMVCIETANVGENSIELKPGQSHTMMATISLE
jgi:glucose-6-phosphate 1-epimerase